MLNKFPLWKYLLILAVLAVGFIYSAPNLYPDDPAIQISGASTALEVGQADLERISQALKQAGIAVKSADLGKQGKGALVRLGKQDDQLPAKELVRKLLGDDYVVALNLAPTTPQWLRSLGAGPMKLGLDLSGGVHFLLEVDMDKAMDARMKVYESEIKSLLRKERVRYRSLPQQDGAVQLGFADGESLEQAQAIIRKNFNDFELTSSSRNEQQVLRIALTEAKRAEIREYSIKQNLTTVRNRVNELGVSEPLVQRQGANRIVLELPLESAVGFERAPKTDKEKAALADAAKLLNDANAVFVPTPAAQCTVESSQVSIPHTDGAAADKDGHADVDATYVFRCANPAALKGVETTLFKHFKRLYRLEARRVGPTGQGSMRLSAKQPTLSW